MNFKKGDRVVYLGGSWESSSFKLKLHGTYTISETHRDTAFRLKEGYNTPYGGWWYDSIAFKKINNLSSKIKIL